MADRITQFGEIRTNEDDKDSQFRNLKKAGARLRAMLGSPEAPVYPEEFTRDDRPISEGDLPEEQEVRALPEEEMAPPVRETAGIEEEAYARLRKAMNPKTPWWAGLSEGGIEGAEHLEDVADKTAQDVLKLRQTDRQLDQADKTSDWKAKYDHLIRKGQIKDLISSGAKSDWARAKALRKQQTDLDKSEVEIKRLTEKQGWEKKYGDENTAKNLADKLHKVQMERARLEIDKAKKTKESGFTLTSPTEPNWNKHMKTVDSIVSGRQMMGDLHKYNIKNASNTAYLKKRFGKWDRVAVEVKEWVNKKMNKEGLTRNGVYLQYSQVLNKIIHERTGAALSAAEFDRLRNEVPNFHSEPWKVMEWLDDFYKRKEQAYFRKMKSLEKEKSGKYGSMEEGTGYFAGYKEIQAASTFGKKSKRGKDYKREYERESEEDRLMKKYNLK